MNLLFKATEACSFIISGSNQFVYEGASVFETAVMAVDGKRIAKWSNQNVNFLSQFLWSA